MESKKSLRYEVLVRPKSAFKEQQSTFSPFSTDDDDSSSVPTALFETEVQRFTCDRENMQQYWIPEGYRPVLIPRAYLADSLVAASHNNSGNSMNPVNSGNVIHQLRSRINNDNINDIEARRRRNFNFNNSTSNNGGIMKKRRRINNINVNSNRRTILGQSPPAVNMNTIVNRQRIKERISAMRNSAVTISPSSILKNNNLSDCSPSTIIGEMWKVESDKVKKHYERLAIRKKIAQALAFEQKFSSSFSGKSSMNHVHVRSTNTTPSSRHRHVNPATCPTTGSSYRSAVRSNAVEGVDTIKLDDNNHQNVDSSPSSSPIIFNDSRPIPDWMMRSDAEDFYDENDENSSDVDLDADNHSTVTTIA